MPIEPKNKDRRDFGDIVSTLGNYVYALRDPRDKKVFYVGQASDRDRLFSHFAEAQKYLHNPETKPTSKILRIIEIWAADEDVDWFILSHGIEESSLNAVESAAIDLLSECQNGPALNRIRGPHSTFLNQEIINDLSAHHVKPQTKLNVVFIFPIQNQLANGVSIYNATRSSWYVKPEFRNKQGAIAVGISNYISRGVFAIDSWQPIGNKFEFIGRDANLPDLENRKWTTIINSALGHWLRGNFLIVAFNEGGQYRFLKGNPDKITWFNC